MTRGKQKPRRPIEPLPLERYADVVAHVEFYADVDEDEVIARLGVSPPVWRATEDHWTDRFLDELRGRGRALREQCDAVVAETRARLERQALPLLMVGLLRREREETRVEVPPELTEKIAELGFGPSAPEPGPEAPKAEVHEGYAALVAARSQHDVSPWARGKPSFLASPAPSPAPGAPPAEAAAPSPAPAPPSARPAPQKTVGMPAFPAPEGKLPFVDKPVAAVLREIEATPPSRPPSPEALGGTVAADGEAATSALPFAEGVALTLQQFASVFVELRAYPQHEADVLKRYGLASRSAFRHVEDGWKSRFGSDANLRSAWIEMCHTYRAWLSKHPLYR